MAAGMPGTSGWLLTTKTGGTILHYDSEYDLIAQVTGQPTQWVVARGTVP